MRNYQEKFERFEKRCTDKLKYAFVTVSGSDLYGFADGHTSDYDFRGVFIQPTKEFLGLIEPQKHVSFVEGEIDTELVEIKRYLKLLIKPNMNYIEWVLAPKEFMVRTSPWLERIQEVARASISKTLFQHIQGMTIHTKKHAEKENHMIPKRELYIIRELLRGYVLFSTKEFISDVRLLAEKHSEEAVFMVDGIIGCKKDGDTINQSFIDKRLLPFLEKLEMDMLRASKFGKLNTNQENALGKANKLLIDIRREYW